MASSSQHRCVFVGNIPYDATEEQLIQICEEVGPVVSFRLVLDRETGKPKGYGFCEYKDEETALSARRNLQGYEINGRQLRVDFAENDKNADRNRDQGRGGPGLAPNIDGQKTAIVTTVLGSSTIHQPMGLPSAANAASDMARVLGGFQISNLPGFQGQPGYGNDPLTLHLAKMSKNQLQEVISEMKGLITQDQSFARQVLQASPQLTKALFQAQIMLGLVPQQMLQMPLNNQSGSAFVPPLVPSEGTVTLTSAAQPALRNTVQPALPNVAQIGTYHQSQDGRIAMLPQNPLIPPQTTIPPRFKFPQGGQPLLSQGATVGKSGVETAQVHPQFVAAANVRQHHPSQSGFLKTSIQHPSLPLPAQNGSSGYRLSSSVLEGVSSAVPPPDSEGYDSVGGSKSSMLPTSGGAPSNLVKNVHDSTELGNQPSKRARLEGEMHTSQIPSRATYSGTSGPALGFISGLATTGQAANIDVQHPEKQSPQLLPEAEAVLLQQVMKLTSEQLNSLPPEQRQQVIHLQRMFRG